MEMSNIDKNIRNFRTILDNSYLKVANLMNYNLAYVVNWN